MADRIGALRGWLAQDPDNTRMLHMLANELANAGRHQEAVEEYARLVGIDANYVPGYLQAGRLCERMGQLDDARSWYTRGVETAQRTGDQHAARENQEALDLL